MRYLLSLTLVFTSLGAVAQPHAEARLNDSPRHHEWIEVEAGAERVVHAFVAYPESDTDARAVIVIHENRGLTDWVRSFADRLAEAGFVAVAPDLLSGFDAEHDGTAAFRDSDAARSAIYELDGAQVMSDLEAVRAHVAAMPGVAGKPAVAGFCWGGSTTFRFATAADDIAAALVFYGTAPDDGEAIAGIDVPVYGFYGADDQRVNATIPATEKLMAEHGKTYDYEIYDGAGHAFMRQGADPEAGAAVIAARDRAWRRLLGILEDLD